MSTESKTTTPPAPGKPIVGEYEGHPVISLPYKEGAKKPFTIGLSKAKLILHNIDAIKAFVASHEGK